MFYRIIIFLLIGALALASGREAMIGFWYLANQQRIADKYCINKDEPLLMCQGKCHLKKVLEGSGSNESRIPLAPPVSQEQLPFHALLYSSAALHLTPPDMPLRGSFFRYCSTYNYEPAFFILRPPWT